MFGPLSAIGDDIAGHAEPVIVEAVSNAVRHSGAEHVTIEITVDDTLRIDVTDDGCGIPTDNTRHSGLANLKRRAELVGGNCEIGSTPDGGTRIRWVAPLAAS